jgi:hypothetical protein
MFEIQATVLVVVNDVVSQVYNIFDCCSGSFQATVKVLEGQCNLLIVGFWHSAIFVGTNLAGSCNDA